MRQSKITKKLNNAGVDYKERTRELTQAGIVEGCTISGNGHTMTVQTIIAGWVSTGTGVAVEVTMIDETGEVVVMRGGILVRCYNAGMLTVAN